MTDFERYLATWILDSGEDQCSRCEYCSLVGKDGLCKNYTSGDFKDDVCIEGMRAFFERRSA